MIFSVYSLQTFSFVLLQTMRNPFLLFFINICILLCDVLSIKVSTNIEFKRDIQLQEMRLHHIYYCSSSCHIHLTPFLFISWNILQMVVEARVMQWERKGSAGTHLCSKPHQTNTFIGRRLNTFNYNWTKTKMDYLLWVVMIAEDDYASPCQLSTICCKRFPV